MSKAAPFFLPILTSQQKGKLVAKNSQEKLAQRADRRALYFPEVSKESIWQLGNLKGFTQVPRVFPKILQIMNTLSDKNNPVGDVYLSLWCRDWSDGFVEVSNANELASECGYVGSRGKTTWEKKMQSLEKLGFIKTKSFPSQKFRFVVLINPFQVLFEKFQEKKIPSESWEDLKIRCEDVGSSDISKLEKTKTKSGGEEVQSSIPSGS